MNGIAELGAADFLSGMQGLLPPGDALPRDLQALLTDLLSGLTGRMVDVHAQASLLSEVESDPRETVLLLPEWQASFGLPDPCAGPSPTLQQSQAQLVARIAGRGKNQSPAFYITFAQNLGYDITITEFRPFCAGAGRAGQPAYGDAWAFAWQVNAPSITFTYFRAGHSAAGEPLADYGNAVLECELNRLKPAHTVILWSYGGGAPISAAFSDDFSIDFQ